MTATEPLNPDTGAVTLRDASAVEAPVGHPLRGAPAELVIEGTLDPIP